MRSHSRHRTQRQRLLRAGDARARCPGAHSVVVTLGEHGAMALREERIVHIDACRVDAVDSTAAGDTFMGALAAASVENMPFEDALQLATCAAALTVTKTGAQQAIPTRTEVEQFLKRR